MIPSILSILILFSGTMGYFYIYDKNTFNNVCFTISYNCIYGFSYGQIKFNQFNRFLKPYIQKGLLMIRKMCSTTNSPLESSSKTNQRVEFVKNGLVIYECSVNDYNSMKNDYDFMIWMSNDVNNTTIHKIFGTIPNDLHSYECEHIFYKFINSEIIINDTNKFNIHFKTEKYNYLIKDNIINKDFIIYFLNKHYKENLGTMNKEELNNIKYKINIIDHNVNFIELENDKVLKLNKNDYDISK
jgi:hypothetical protein